MAEPCCSFCRKPESQVRKLVQGGINIGRPVFICDKCVRLAQSPFATIAHCASCQARNGKHDPHCPDQELTA